MRPDRAEHADPQAQGDREMAPLLALWEATAPPDPGPAVWDALRRRVEARVTAQAPPRRAGRGAWALSLAACAAAAAVFAVTAAWPEPARAPDARPAAPGFYAVAERGPDEFDGEPFPVVGTHLVNIISMDAGDADALALGEDPMLGDIELTRLEDITLIQVGPGQEDRPAAEVQQGPFPMIVPGLASAREQ